MDLKNTTLAKYCRIALGIVFIISALSKALDTNYFGEILSSYGNAHFYRLAPIVIFAELYIGISLMANVGAKFAALFAATMLVGFTIIYTYGLMAIDIKDCGCYGKISFLNSSPTFLYLRNLLLLLGTIFVFIYSDNLRINLHSISFLSTSLLIFIAAFLCGHSFYRNLSINNHNKDIEFKAIPLSQHILNQYIETTADSTYLISVFSYSCPHCINSIGNTEQYQELNVVDKVIGLGINNPDETPNFHNLLQPSFTVTNFTLDEISDLTTEFPVYYFIRNDSIVKEIKGEIPSAYFFLYKTSSDE